MSVPAFKNSRSKVRRRRSHHALKPLQLVKDKVTGEYKLPHHALEAPVAPPATAKEAKPAMVKKEKSTKDETAKQKK